MRIRNFYKLKKHENSSLCYKLVEYMLNLNQASNSSELTDP